MSAQKSLQGSEKRELLVGTEEKSVSSMRGLYKKGNRNKFSWRPDLIHPPVFVWVQDQLLLLLLVGRHPRGFELLLVLQLVDGYGKALVENLSGVPGLEVNEQLFQGALVGALKRLASLISANKE